MTSCSAPIQRVPKRRRVGGVRLGPERIGGVIFVLLVATARGVVEAGPAKDVENSAYPEALQASVRDALQQGTVDLLALVEAKLARMPKTPGADDIDALGVAVHAALHCGVPATTEVVVRATRVLRETNAAATPPRTLGRVALALAAKYVAPTDPFGAVTPQNSPTLDETDATWLGACVQRLEATQVRVRYIPVEKLPRLKAPTGDRRSAGTLEPPRAWGDPNATHVGMDTSLLFDSTIAVLGLDAAARCGVQVDSKTWAAALSYFLALQPQTGRPATFRGNEVAGDRRLEWREPSRARPASWAFELWGDANGSTVACVMLGVSVCADRLRGAPSFTPPVASVTRDAIRDALTWLQLTYAVRVVPGKNNGWGPDPAEYRYLLSCATRFLGVRFIGDHDVYQDVAELVLANCASRAKAKHGFSASDRSGPFDMLALAGHPFARGGSLLRDDSIDSPR